MTYSAPTPQDPVPDANAYAERSVRTVRSECLDHLLVVNQRHLERILHSYARHYNGHCLHQDISQAIPAPHTHPSSLIAVRSQSPQANLRVLNDATALEA